MIWPVTIGIGLGIVAVSFSTSASAQNAPSFVEQTASYATPSGRAMPRTRRATRARAVAGNSVVSLPAAIASVFAAQPQAHRPDRGARPSETIAPLGTGFDSAIARHALLNGVPESLVRRVIKRESGGRAHVVSAGNYGLMQIKPATARGVGYSGSPAGLLDPETNLTYAVRYLAGAYRAAGGNHDRAVQLYASGYYYEAKRQGLTRAARRTLATAQ